MNCDLAVRQPWIDARDAGMVDVAAWRADQSGQLPQPTYRGKSRLDYIICNQFALRHLLSFDQDPFGYTDHAILRCTFDWKPCAAGLSWTMPSDLASIPGFLEQVRDREVQECPDFPLHLDAFQSFCWMYERHVSKVFQDLFGKNIPPKYLGRGKGRLVQRPFTHGDVRGGGFDRGGGPRVTSARLLTEVRNARNAGSARLFSDC